MSEHSAGFNCKLPQPLSKMEAHHDMFENGKLPQFFNNNKMEDYLNCFENGGLLPKIMKKAMDLKPAIAVA